MVMLETVLSALMIVSVVFLLYELYKFRVLHARKYELPTEKIWEKFVGIRPEDMAEFNLTEKVQHLEKKIDDVQEQLEKQIRLNKKLIEELGK